MALNIPDHIVINNGESINGEVLVNTFGLKTKYGNLKIAKSDIREIDFRNPPYTQSDQVVISAGTRLSGDVTPAIIPVRVEQTSATLKIPKTDLRTLLFFKTKGKVSAATRKAIKSVS